MRRFILAGLMFSLGSLAQADPINILLDNDTLSGTPGATLHFFGNLTNTTGGVVFLNTDVFGTSNGFLGFDDTPFFTNAPLSMAPGEVTASFEIFDISIDSLTPLGTYSLNNFFNISGGATVDDTTFLGQTGFTVDVVALPEPSTLWLSLGAFVALAGYIGVRRARGSV